jgi:hypothetical protein
MLPPSPPTDPDVPDYSIRFFTGELRWRWRVDAIGHSLVEDRFLARSAIHWHFVVRLRSPCLLACVLPMALSARRPPSLLRVPPSTVPRSKKKVSRKFSECCIP